MSHWFKLATFNLKNLVLPEKTYYRKLSYTTEDYEKKIDWSARQITKMNADIIGFQEVFHKEALKAALLRSDLKFSDDQLVTLELHENKPGLGLFTRYPILSTKTITEFPANAIINIQSKEIPLTHFRHPVLNCHINLPGNIPVSIYIAHLKSKRPLTEEGEHLKHNETLFAMAKARSLILRSAEATALRDLIVKDLIHNLPVIIMGDLNDSVDSVTTRILMGDPPQKKFDYKDKQRIFKTLLHSTYDLQSYRSDRDVYYTHIHNGKHESLDHILVSDHFHYLNPDKIGEVDYMHLFNDHVIDETLSHDTPDYRKSDHGQVVVTIRLIK